MTEPSFSTRNSLSGVLRRLVQLSGRYPDLELTCTLQNGKLTVGIPKGISGDELEDALSGEPLGEPIRDEAFKMLGQMTEGRTFRVVAPLVRNAAGKYECVCSIIYNAEGVPVELILAGEGRQVPIAEWQPMQEL